MQGKNNQHQLNRNITRNKLKPSIRKRRVPTSMHKESLSTHYIKEHEPHDNTIQDQENKA